jgi:Dit-like phage tail protein
MGTIGALTTLSQQAAGIQGQIIASAFNVLDFAAPTTNGPFRPPQWKKPLLTTLSVNLPNLSKRHVDTAIIDPSQIQTGKAFQPNLQKKPGARESDTTPTTLFFDAVFRVSHRSELRLTEHPIQTGSNLVDHAYALPKYVTVEAGMSDAMALYKSGVYTSGNKSVSAYQLLEKIQGLRIPITLTTRLETYTNMLIEFLSAEDTVRTRFGLKTEIRLRQLILGTVAANTISARPDQTDGTSVGTKSTQSVPPALQKFYDPDSGAWDSNTLQPLVPSHVTAPPLLPSH